VVPPAELQAAVAVLVGLEDALSRLPVVPHISLSIDGIARICCYHSAGLVVKLTHSRLDCV